MHFLIIPQLNTTKKNLKAQPIHIHLNINHCLWAPANKQPLGTLSWLHKHVADRYDCSYLPLIFLFISLPICLLCQFQPPQAAIWKHVARLIVSLHQLFPSSL